MGTCNWTPPVPPTFNLAVFLARYAEFTAYAAANTLALPAMFLEAQLYFSRFGEPNALTYLNMLTAHIAFLAGAFTTDGQARPVGRMTDATEGSVSASFEGVTPTPGTGSWFMQSQYGAAFWQATSSLRGFRYRARPTFVGGPFRFKPFGRGF